MEALRLVGYAAVFGSISLAFVSLLSGLQRKRRVQQTLRSLRAIDTRDHSFDRDELAIPLIRRVIKPALKGLGEAARRITPAGAVERLGHQLDYAGGPVGWDAERVLAVKVVGGIVALGLALLIGAASNAAPARIPLLGLTFAMIGAYVPDWILRGKAQSRQEAIKRALPDTLDLLSITVQAGLGFDAAVFRGAKQIGGPLGEELHRVAQEMQLGRSRADALRDLAERSSLPELRSFVFSLVQTDMFGIPIAKVLEVQAREMRIRRRQDAEEKAQKVPVKMVFPLLFCIFPALFVVLIGPAVIRISESLFNF